MQAVPLLVLSKVNKKVYKSTQSIYFFLSTNCTRVYVCARVYVCQRRGCIFGYVFPVFILLFLGVPKFYFCFTGFVGADYSLSLCLSAVTYKSVDTDSMFKHKYRIGIYYLFKHTYMLANFEF